jgi:hypothetical protein
MMGAGLDTAAELRVIAISTCKKYPHIQPSLPNCVDMI